MELVEKFAAGIGLLLSVQAVITAVLVTGKVHGGDCIAINLWIRRDFFSISHTRWRCTALS